MTKEEMKKEWTDQINKIHEVRDCAKAMADCNNRLALQYDEEGDHANAIIYHTAYVNLIHIVKKLDKVLYKEI